MDIENKLKNLHSFINHNNSIVSLDGFEDTCGFGCPDCEGKVYGKYLSGEYEGHTFKGCACVLKEKFQDGIYYFRGNSIEKI